ncbi:hypothetical protein KKF11_02650, partial [Patescibacteria group bacterium]|nr:hypothetical protein [Patescibacteria group bacterium]
MSNANCQIKNTKRIVFTLFCFIFLVFLNKVEGEVVAFDSKAIRGQARDLWADIIIGQPDFSETAEWATVSDKVWNPGGVVIDRSSSPNKIYVWDSGNNRILGFDLDKCFQKDSQDRCGADIIIGQSDGYSSGCNRDSGHQNHPDRPIASANSLCGLPEFEKSPGEGGSSVSMAVDNEGSLYVPDFHNNRVLKYIKPFETDTTADEIWGQDDFSQNLPNKGLGIPNAESFSFYPFGNEVAGVEMDSDGYLWVADKGNNRVLRFAPGSKTADLVLGQVDFSSRVAGSQLNQLNRPAAVRVRGQGDNKQVFVADFRNGRVLVFKTPFQNGMQGEIFGSGFHRVSGIEFDSQGEGVWINDTRDAGKGLIELWNNQGTELLKFLGSQTYAPYQGERYDSFGNGFFKENYGSLGISSSGDICTATRWGDVYSQMDTSHNLLCFKAPLASGGTGKFADISFFYPPGKANFTTRNEIGSVKSIVAVDNQLIVADYGRVLFWNGLSSLSSGKLADGVINYDQLGNFSVSMAENDFKIRDSNFWDTALTSDKSHHLYVLNFAGWRSNPLEILIYNLPLQEGDQVYKKISFPIPFLGGGEFNPQGNFEVGGIAATDDGEFLWITESDASRVVRIRNPLGENPVADVVIGQDNINAKSCNKGLYPCDGHWCAPPESHFSRTASTLCLPGLIKLDNFGNLYVSDNSIETRGNKRLMIYSSNSFPTGNTTTIFGVEAIKIIDRIEPLQPAFDSQNHMVVGFNPFRNRLDAGLADCPETFGAGACHFTAIYQNVLGDSISPDGYLNDFFIHPYVAAFDENDNLYIGDMNRARVLVYNQPFFSGDNPPVCDKLDADANDDGLANLADFEIW